MSAAGGQVLIAKTQAVHTARALHASLGIASLGVLAAAALLQVEDSVKIVLPFVNRALPELCYFKTMFGLDCPGCGLTRCFVSAAHGQVADAWRFNPVGLLLFVGLLWQIPYRPWQLWRISTGRGELKIIDLPYVMLGISVLLIVQWFWRLLA